MEDALIIRRLTDVDRKLHLLLNEVRYRKPKIVFTLEQLNQIMEKDRILDEDSTIIIRKMRNKDYE